MQSLKRKSALSCYDRVEGKIGSAFEALGHRISKHPWKIIIVVVLINGLLGIGMLKLESDIDVSRVYTPMNSQAVEDEKILKKILPDKSGTEFYRHQLIISGKSAVVIVKPCGGTILDIAFLKECLQLDAIVRGITVDRDGEAVRYRDICARRNNTCVVSGDEFLSSEFQRAVKNQNVTYPLFRFASGRTTSYDNLVSEPTVQNGTLVSASHLKLEYFLRSDSDDFILSAQTWEKQFIKIMKAFASKRIDVAFAHTDSLSEELNRNIKRDISLFSVTFTVMIAYACLATYSAKHDCVGNRVMLGIAGVLAAGLSIVAAFGLVGVCGMKFVSIVGNLPFLVIGIGVDDMFILLSGLANALCERDTRSRIGKMLRQSGVAITITSLTDILAFGAGACSTFRSVRNFCVYTGVAVFFCYLNQTFLFSACITVNEQRVRSKRHVFCCSKTHSKREMEEDGIQKRRIFCCAGELPKTREAVEGFPEKGIRKYFIKFVLLTPVKIIVLIIFSAYLVISIWGATKLKQGLVIKELVSEDSYFYKYTTWEDEFFSSSLPIALVIDKTHRYSAADTQNLITDLISDAQANSYVRSDLALSWLHAYKSATAYYNDTSEIDFVNGLRLFLQQPQYQQFTNDILLDEDTISVSRVYVFITVIDNSQDKGSMMEEIREIASRSPLSVIAFSPAFIFYEQYLAILPQTLQTLGIAVVAVCLVTALFMPQPLLLSFVAITMAMILVGIIGFMYFWNLTLSSVTMIHLILSIGFSVDFTAHICHAFMIAKGPDRNTRVNEAIISSGGPIFNGTISSILGILMLAVSKSYIFRSFFKVMLLVIVFGSFHALLFLPTILSFVGPHKTALENTESRKHENKPPGYHTNTNRNAALDSRGQLNTYAASSSHTLAPLTPVREDRIFTTDSSAYATDSHCTAHKTKTPIYFFRA